MNLFEVAKEIVKRLGKIFLRDEQGRRPVYGATEKFQSDPHWRDNILFFEYFHGDNGAGHGREPSDRLDGPRGSADKSVRPSRPRHASRRGTGRNVQKDVSVASIISRAG